MSCVARRSLTSALRVTAFAVAVLGGCSASGSSSGGGASSSGATSTTSASGGTAPAPVVNESRAPTCHDVEQVGGRVEFCSSKETPAPLETSAGLVPDGTYVLISNSAYANAVPNCSSVGRQTLVVVGSTWYRTWSPDSDGDAASDWRHTFHVTASAEGVLTFDVACENVKKDLLQGAKWAPTPQGFQLVSGSLYSGADSQNAILEYARK